MLAIILKILSILGMIFLILLALFVLALLSVLLMPIVYKVNGEKNAEVLHVTVKMRWMFGLVRAGINYPKPGNFVVKVLWLPVYDSAKSVSAKDRTEETTNTVSKTEAASDGNVPSDIEVQVSDDAVTEEKVSESKETSADENSSNDSIKSSEAEYSASQEDETNSLTLKEKLFAKYEKIKYTIRKIYDKIKHVLENLAFYKDLLQYEDTKLLISHAFTRLRKILKSIRPRKLKADVVFGTGAPDTTGYAFAVYGMLSPKLGNHVLVTPDFTQQILEGHVYAAGHITVFTLLRHSLSILFDKRLRLLKHKLDVHKKKMKQQT